MSTINSSLGQINSYQGIRSGPPVNPKKEVTDQPVRNDDNLVSVNFSPATPASTPVVDQSQTAVAQAPPDISAKAPPEPPPLPVGTTYGTSGTLFMTNEPVNHTQNSSIDGFLARLAGDATPKETSQQSAFNKGLDSSGTVLKRAMVDAADFGNRVGKMLGCDETAPGLKGFVGTTLSLGASMVGGLVAMPLALVVGVADAVS